jgi:hypothetical protein
MAAPTTCPPFWAQDPGVLAAAPLDFFPFSAAAQRCSTTALNALTRFGVVLAVALALVTRDGAYLGLAPLLAVVAAAAFFGMARAGTLRTEGFRGDAAKNAGPAVRGLGPEPLTAPAAAAGYGDEDDDRASVRSAGTDVIGLGGSGGDGASGRAGNPFMNALVTQLAFRSSRPELASVAAAQAPDSARVRKALAAPFPDPDDPYGTMQNQRTWTHLPSSDRGEWQAWLFDSSAVGAAATQLDKPGTPGYKQGAGGSSAAPGAEGAVYPWLN